MSEPKSPILRRQNEPSMRALLQAMSVSHARAQRLATLRTLLSAGLAVSGLVAAFIDVSTAITIAGALWAVLYSVGLASWGDGELRRAAVLQEMFDVRLFGIPWNKVIAGEQVGAQEVNRLSKKFAGRQDMICDYYEIPDLPHPYDVLGCQQQNLGWGTRIRRRYANTVFFSVLGWSIAGILIGLIANLTVGQLILRWYVPSLGAMLLGLDVFRSQRGVAAERERTFRIVGQSVKVAIAQAQTQTAHDELKGLARQVQDLLFLTRVRAPRVPDWFFHRFHVGDRADFKAVMDELEGALAAVKSG